MGLRASHKAAFMVSTGLLSSRLDREEELAAKLMHIVMVGLYSSLTVG